MNKVEIAVLAKELITGCDEHDWWYCHWCPDRDEVVPENVVPSGKRLRLCRTCYREELAVLVPVEGRKRRVRQWVFYDQPDERTDGRMD